MVGSASHKNRVLVAVVALVLLGACSDEGGSAGSSSVDDGGADRVGIDAGDAAPERILRPPADAPPPPPPPTYEDPEPAPTWEPGFLSEDVGWQQSRAPLCNPFTGRPRGVDIWADGRGVFVVEDIRNVRDLGPGSVRYPSGTAVHFNEGSGWETWYEARRRGGVGGASELTGIPNGSVWMLGGACPLRRLDGPGDSRCVYTKGRPDKVHMTGDREGWIVRDGAEATLIKLRDGEVVASHGTPDGSRIVDLGADDRGVVVLTSSGVYERTGTGLESLSDLPPIPEDQGVSATWVGSRDDIWLGTDASEAEGMPFLLHYDGTEWNTIRIASTDALETGFTIGHLWSDGEKTYFATAGYSLRTIFGRWTPSGGTEFLLVEFEEGDVGLAASSNKIVSMDGNTARGEIYLAFDSSYRGKECGPAMMVWFDGEAFHRF